MDSMDKEIVIKLLDYYGDIDDEIRFFRGRIKNIETTYYNPIGAIQNDGLPKGKNNISRPVEEMILAIPDDARILLKSYENQIKRLQALKSEMLREISRLELREKSIITDYYVHKMKWELVAVRNHYSVRQCKNIRNAAVENLVRRFKSNANIADFKTEL